MSRFIVPFMDFFRKATDAPEVYGEAAALMALSGIALSRRWVDVGEGIQANLYCMIVGDSSVTRKSTSVNYAKKMLNFVEHSRVAPNDYTMEGLMKWMGEPLDGEPKGSKKKQNNAAIFSDEFGTDLSRMTAYGPTMQADFCRLYDGEAITKVRVASSPLIVERPRVSLLAGAAYQMLEQHLSTEDWKNGFLLRFLYVAPPDKPDPNRPQFSIQPKRPQLEWDIAQAALSGILVELDTPRQCGPPALPGLTSPTRTWFGVDISPAAQARLDAMTTYFTAISPGLSFIMVKYIERFKGSVLKVALLFQIDEDSTQPIGLNAMQRALSFCGNCWESFKVAHEKTTSNEFSSLVELVTTTLLANAAAIDTTTGVLRYPRGTPIRELARKYRSNRQLLKVIEYLIGSDLARRQKVSIQGQATEVLELTM